MPTLDAFNSDNFGTQSLTSAINKAPFAPGRLGGMGLFREKRITTTNILADEQDNKISLLLSAARGTEENVASGPSRTARSFRVPHFPQYATILADDVQNIRAFGSETELETLSGRVNEVLAQLRQSHEVTMEFLRVGAIKGVVLDGDASTTLYNLFTEFGVTQTVLAIDWSSNDPKTNTLDIVRAVQDGMGNASFTGIHALCGNTFFDEMVKNTNVEAAYDRWREGEFLRGGQLTEGNFAGNLSAGAFPYGGIMWENYRGTIGGTVFIPDDEAYLFPVGVNDDTYIEAIAPGDMAETVNTLGQRVYAKQERLPFDKGIRLHTQHNVLPLCTRLGALVKLTT